MKSFISEKEPLDYLESRGYRNDPDLGIIYCYRQPTNDEAECLTYLMEHWDWEYKIELLDKEKSL